MYFILGASSIFLGLIYYFRNNIIYHFILYYDKLLLYKQKKISCTGINNKEITEFNYYLSQKYLNYDIIIVNFSINNKPKRLIVPDPNIDFSNLNYIPYYNSPIILASVDLDYISDTSDTSETSTATSLSIANKLTNIAKEIDITHELNEFILHDCNINLNNNKLSKLMWISIINKKYNTNYSKDLYITYNIMLQDISNWSKDNINITVTNGIIKLN